MTTARAVHNGRAERFDLDAAADAALKDQNREPFRFSYKGADYEIPNASAWPLEAQRQLSKGELEGALGMLLGTDEMDALSKAGITVGELGVLFDAIGQASGIGDLPNSRARQQAGSTRK
jgi:hypothetical protein